MKTLYEIALQHKEAFQIEKEKQRNLGSFGTQAPRTVRERLEETLTEEPFASNPFVQRMPQQALDQQVRNHLRAITFFGGIWSSERREAYNTENAYLTQLIPEAEKLTMQHPLRVYDNFAASMLGGGVGLAVATATAAATHHEILASFIGIVAFRLLFCVDEYISHELGQAATQTYCKAQEIEDLRAGIQRQTYPREYKENEIMVVDWLGVPV